MYKVSFGFTVVMAIAAVVSRTIEHNSDRWLSFCWIATVAAILTLAEAVRTRSQA